MLIVTAKIDAFKLRSSSKGERREEVVDSLLRSSLYILSWMKQMCVLLLDSFLSYPSLSLFSLSQRVDRGHEPELEGTRSMVE